MKGVNRVTLIGTLGRDPELKFTPGGSPVCNFSVATNEEWFDKKSEQKQKKTEWHNIVVWGGLAELCNKYLKKGSGAYIEGRIETKPWDDKDGNKKYRTEIVAKEVQFLGGGTADRNDNEGSAPSEQQVQREHDNSTVDEDSLPF
jgi:single-strand DNA-binding protein